MTFLHPEFLWGFLALAIPIIVHLFHFRRFKKIDFSNVDFLKNINKQQENKRKLKYYLILASRLLAITFLVLAFAIPIKIADKLLGTKDQKHISLFLDNSLSMASTGSDGILLEAAKNRARDIVKNFSPTDKYQIITNDLNEGSSRYYGQEKAIEKIDETNITAASKKLNQVLNWQKSNYNKEGLYRFILSDFQKSVSNFSQEIEQEKNTYLVPVPLMMMDNVSVDSCWFTSPIFALGEEVVLKVKVHNYNKESIAENILSLSVNDQVKSTASFEINPSSGKELELKFKLDKLGYSAGILSLTGDERAFDDKLYFTFNAAGKSKVLVINGNGSNKYLTKLFSKNENIEYQETSINGLDYSAIKTYNLVILNECSNVPNALLSACNELTKNGGNSMLIPSKDGDNKAFGYFGFNLKGKNNSPVRFGEIAINHSYFNGVFQQNKRQSFNATSTQYYNLTGGNSLFGLANGKQFANIKSSNKGFAIAIAAPLNSSWTEFPVFEYFVPFMLRASSYGKSSETLFQIVGSNEYFSVKLPSKDFDKLQLRLQGQSFIPETKYNREGLLLKANESIKTDGIYALSNSKSKSLLAQIAFNYNRNESEIENLNADALSNLGFKNVLNANMENFESTLKQESKGTPYWKYCIILVLLFLGIEVLIIKLIKP